MEVVDLSSTLRLTSSTGTITSLAELGETGDELLVPNSYTFYGETTVVALLLLIGSTLNGPLLYVYCVSNQARSIADKFLINLILADIFSLVLLLPTIIVDLFMLERNEEDFLRNMTQLVSEIGDISKQFVSGGSRTNVFANDTGPGPGPSAISTHLYPILSALSSNSSFSRISFNGTTFGDGSVEAPFRLVELVETWDWACTFKKCLFSGIATASILSTLEIAMERYLAIVTPLHYHKFLTKYKVMMTSFGGGFIAIGSAVLSALDPCEPVFPSCTRTTVSYTSTFWWPLYTLGHVTLFFILPVLCMACIYIKIWLEARRQKAKISLQYKRPFFLHVTPSNPTGNDLKEKPKFFLHPVVLRFRFIDRFVTARMDRAARVAICTLMVTIVCWSPYYFVQCAHSIRSIMEQLKGQVRVKESWSHLESTVPLLAASLHPVLAPFFYGYRYTVIRDRVFMLFKLDKWYPAIRERRSNSVSQHQSPSRAVRRKLEGPEELNRQLDAGVNNHQQWKEQRDDSDDRLSEMTDASIGHTIITIDGPETSQKSSTEDDPPHPFLFTIGAVDEDDDRMDPNFLSPYYNRYRNYGHMKSNMYEYIGGESNSSSSDALLTHHYCSNFLYDDPNHLPHSCDCSKSACKSYDSCCLNPNLCSSNNLSLKSNSSDISITLTPPPPASNSLPELSINKMLMMNKNNEHGNAQQHCWAMWSNMIQQMIEFYTQRWGSHRQSVSSNSSVVTLLSSRSISSEYLPS